MLARLIIEQKVKDLELAFVRQEELLKSQREVLASLKELILLELTKADPIPDPAPLLETHAPTETTVVEDKAPAKDSSIALPPPVAKHNADAMKSPAETKKRAREAPSKDGKDSPTEPMPVKLARSQVPVVAPATLALVSGKRRRALDKVNQFCAQLPALFPVPWSISTGRTVAVSVVASPPSSSSGPFGVIDRVSHGTAAPRSLENQSVFAKALVHRNASTEPQQAVAAAHASAARFAPVVSPPVPAAPVAASAPASVRALSPAITAIASSATVSPALPAHRPVTTLPFTRLTALQLLSHCGGCISLSARSDALKMLAAAEAKDIKHFLEAGGKDLLLGWVCALEVETSLDDGLGGYIEGCLLLLKQAAWTNEAVSQTRFDKVLRKIFKKYSTHSNILTESLSALLREMWGQFRYSYNTFKAAHQEGDDRGAGRAVKQEVIDE